MCWEARPQNTHWCQCQINHHLVAVASNMNLLTHIDGNPTMRDTCWHHTSKCYYIPNTTCMYQNHLDILLACVMSNLLVAYISNGFSILWWSQCTLCVDTGGAVAVMSNSVVADICQVAPSLTSSDPTPVQIPIKIPSLQLPIHTYIRTQLVSSIRTQLVSVIQGVFLTGAPPKSTNKLI